MLKFYTQREQLTRYALACGYIERRNGYTLSMPAPSAGVYQVTADEGGIVYNGRSLKEARKSMSRRYILPAGYKPEYKPSNPKIDLYRGGHYLYSTNFHRTCRDALAYHRQGIMAASAPDTAKRAK
jgi:hypothetical protein